MINKIVTSFFTKNGIPQTGLTPTINIWLLDPNNPNNNTLVVNNDSLTEIASGWYRYTFTAYDIFSNYVFLVDGGTSLSGGERYAPGSNDSFQEDIAVSTWEEPAILHTTTGSMGLLENQIKADTGSISISMASAISLVTTLLKYEKNRTRINTMAKTLTVYDDDGLTPLKVFDLKDSSGNSSVIEVAERMPQ